MKIYVVINYTANIISGGYDNSSYSLKSGVNTTNKWKQTTSDSLPNNVRSISLWHKTTSTTVGSGNSNDNSYILDYRNDSNNNGAINLLVWLRGIIYNKKK